MATFPNNKNYLFLFCITRIRLCPLIFANLPLNKKAVRISASPAPSCYLLDVFNVWDAAFGDVFSKTQTDLSETRKRFVGNAKRLTDTFAKQ